MTTQLLKKAFAEAAKLPDHEQDSLAAVVMEEMEAVRKWDDAFAGSQDLLARMADQALAEHQRGETRPLDGLLTNRE